MKHVRTYFQWNRYATYRGLYVDACSYTYRGIRDIMSPLEKPTRADPALTPDDAHALDAQHGRDIMTLTPVSHSAAPYCTYSPLCSDSGGAAPDTIPHSAPPQSAVN